MLSPVELGVRGFWFQRESAKYPPGPAEPRADKHAENGRPAALPTSHSFFKVAINRYCTSVQNLLHSSSQPVPKLGRRLRVHRPALWQLKTVHAIECLNRRPVVAVAPACFITITNSACISSSTRSTPCWPRLPSPICRGGRFQWQWRQLRAL